MSEKILIVDDDLDTLKLVGLMLQRQGYDIVAANGGAQGLEKAAAERPSLILLDLMMPDMDGYEVTRRLRSDPGLAHIPIIMFTAKTLVDDKVAGFEAGADDYLTKPTHPAELTAHVKAVLARAATSRAAPSEHARTLGCVGARGGVGTTTLAVNISAVLARGGDNVILADLNSGQGSMALQLGYTRPMALTNLLKKRPEEITPRVIEGQLVTHSSGIRLLLASYGPSDSALLSGAAQVEAIVRHLTGMCKVLVLDLGAGLSEASRRAIALCDQVIMPIEPNRISVAQTQAFMADLDAIGVGQGRVSLVLVNRVRSSLQLTVSKLEQSLNHRVATVITPAPELAYQANEAGAPLVLLQPDSLTADQISRLTQMLVQKGPAV
ncbi:MAG: response regulator [Chloroflexi bacterium]|nr:response regulator [Chloroflexota bacterium]